MIGSGKDRSGSTVRVLGAMLAASLVGACGHSAGDSVEGFSVRPVAFCGSGAFATSHVVSDFNGDGADDVAVGCRTLDEPRRGSVELWLSDGQGTLLHAQTIAMGTEKFSSSESRVITAADFNNDGHLDILLVDFDGSSPWTAFIHGRESGHFGKPEYFQKGGNWAASSDVDDDGYPDLMYTIGGSSISYLPNTRGKLDPEARLQNLAPDTNEVSNSVADTNGDRLSDVVVYLPKLHKFLVYPSGDAPYELQLEESKILPWEVLAGARIDDDDVADLFVLTNWGKADQAVRVLLTKGGPHWSEPLPVPRDEYSGSFAQAGDFNGDGMPDLLIGGSEKESGGRPVHLLVGQADGSFKKSTRVTLPDYSHDIVAGDFNADGKDDFVYRSASVDKKLNTTYQSFVYLNKR